MVEYAKEKKKYFQPEDDAWYGDLFYQLQDILSNYSPSTKKEANKIRETISQLRTWFDNEYRNKLGIKSTGQPYWLEKDPIYKKMPPLFLPIYKELFANTIPSRDKENNELIAKAGGKPFIDGKTKEDVCVIPNIADIASKLEVSQITVRKYIQAMTKAGILKKLKRPGSNDKFVYSLGYWLRAVKKDKETGEIEDMVYRRMEFIRLKMNRDAIKAALENLKL